MATDAMRGEPGKDGPAKDAAALEPHPGNSIALRLERELDALSALIARVLHEDIGPQLATLRSLAASLEAKQLERNSANSLTTTLILRQTDSLIESVRNLVAQVRPDALSAGGLPEALRSLVADWRLRRPDARIELLLDPPQDREFGLASSAVESLVLQAAVTVFERAFDSARAESLVLDASRDGAHLVMLIVHDGGGPGAIRRGGAHPTWLSSIAERVSELGGVLSAEPGEGGGASISLRLPWGPSV